MYIQKIDLGATDQEEAVLAARRVLDRMLAQLQDYPDKSRKVTDPRNTLLKTCNGVPCLHIGAPTHADNLSNAVVWPVKDFDEFERAWATCQAYAGTPTNFALKAGTVAQALLRTKVLIDATDVKLRFRGLSSKSAPSFWPWLVGGGAALLGAVWFATKKKKPTP